MVAQVVKLPSVATNEFKSGNLGKKVRVDNVSAQNVQLERERSKELAKQAVQNIEVVREAAKDLNDFAKSIQTNLSFSIDEGSGRSVITVTDSQTGDIIRQIPAKEVLAVANLIREATASDTEKVGILLTEQG